MGISFVLCKKQAQLLLPNKCQADEVAAKSGCGTNMEKCWCTSGGGKNCGPCSPTRGNMRWLDISGGKWCQCKPDQCTAPTECYPSNGYQCFADAAGCNILPDNAVNQVLDSLPYMLERMGVRAASDYDLAHYFTKTPQAGHGLGGAGVCGQFGEDGGHISTYPEVKARGASGMKHPHGDSFSAGLFAHVRDTPPFAHACCTIVLLPARE